MASLRDCISLFDQPAKKPKILTEQTMFFTFIFTSDS